MQLNFKVSGQGFPLVILHGLMGSLDNWQTMARHLSDTYRVYTVDLRDHGRSPHTDAISYPLMAGDLLEFFDQQNINQAHVLGHSMGGKVAMEFTLRHSSRVKKQIIADIAPKVYGRYHDDVFETLFAVDLSSITSRGKADEVMKQYMPDTSMRQFLLKSLHRTTEGKYEWKMNVQMLYDNYSNITANISDSFTAGNETLVIRGGRSKYVSDDDLQLFRRYFPDTSMITIENSGHWIHAEAPSEFLEAVRNFLNA
jgi:pimeloyl-ACP methyl ester carboxylesterase